GQGSGHLSVRRLVLGARLRHGRAATSSVVDRHHPQRGDHRGPADQHDPLRPADRRPGPGHGRRYWYPSRADVLVRDLPADRAVAAERGGGRVSTSGSKPSPPARGPFGAMMGGGPPAKAINFKGSLHRLLARMRGERRLVAAAGVLATVSVALSVIGPKILGHATDLIFTGLVGGRLPAGATKAQAVAQLRASGQGRIADMVSAMDVMPGRGVDFDAVGQVLLAVLLLYVAASVFSWFQGRVTTVIVQHTVY